MLLHFHLIKTTDKLFRYFFVIFAFNTLHGCSDTKFADSMFRNDLSRSGMYLSQPLKEGPAIKWKFDSGAPISSSAAIANGRMFVGSSNGIFSCLRRNGNTNPAFADTIRRSATAKIKKVEDPEPDSVPHRRAHHELLYDESTKSVMMVSGSTPLNGGESFRFFNDIWRLTESGWVKSGIAGDERSGIRLAYDTKRNRIFSFGGFSGNSSKSELRLLTDHKWKILSDVPEMQAAEPGFVYDSFHDKLITFGGSAAMGKVNSTTWLWDGRMWEKFVGNGPDGRQAFVMVYDSKRNRTVLFGGMGSSDQLYGDTWEFDGDQWAKVSETGPGARMASGFTFDSKRGMVVIFGGTANGVVMGDTWGWNGTTWKKLADTGPAPRMMGYLAYDKNRDKIVLFGGRVRWPEDKNDTWEWDGTEWREIK